MLQHFIQESVCSHIPSETQPQLYDMGKIRPEISAYPRIVLIRLFIFAICISVCYSKKEWFRIQTKIRGNDI